MGLAIIGTAPFVYKKRKRLSFNDMVNSLKDNMLLSGVSGFPLSISVIVMPSRTKYEHPAHSHT